MCLIVVAYRQIAQWPLIVLANRDEFHARQSAPLALWGDQTGIAAGRDLRAGGTWMAVLPDGRFAAVTNARVPGGREPRPRSRGTLVVNTLQRDTALADLSVDAIANGERISDYAPFGLLAGGTGQLAHWSNCFDSAGQLPLGMHALSNGPMNAPWPKALRASQAMRELLLQKTHSVEQLLAIMGDSQFDATLPLPDTGVGGELERRLAPVFLRDPIYGTRATTLLRVDTRGRVELIERRYAPSGEAAGETRMIAEDGQWRRTSDPSPA